jgi:hypothetical protein
MVAIVSRATPVVERTGVEPTVAPCADRIAISVTLE